MNHPLYKYPNLVKYLQSSGDLKVSDITSIEVRRSKQMPWGSSAGIKSNVVFYILKGNGFTYELEHNEQTDVFRGKFIE